MVNMLGVVAAWEREVIGERTATALAHKRQLRTAYGPTHSGLFGWVTPWCLSPRNSVRWTKP